MPPPSPAAWREASPDGQAPPWPKPPSALSREASPDGRAPSRPIKRYRRFPYYDYSRGAALFITISTSPRADLFGKVVEAQMQLSPLGSQVLESLEAIPRFNPGFALHGHVVMPDHVHFNLWLPPRLPDPVKALGAAIRRFKTWTSTLARKELGIASLWQQGCHDRICTSERFIDSTERYIAYNPLKWELGKNQPEFLRIREPLNSPRLDPAEYWRGVGNTELLDPKHKILSLRVSRQVKDFSRLLARIQDAARADYAILSGFISPGELAVRDMLLADPAAKLIRILPDRMAIGHRPESRYLPAIQERRYLEIAEGNEPSEFSRAACLDLNAAIVSIATEGEGLAVYWKAEGPTVIGEGGASPSGLASRHAGVISPDQIFTQS